MANRYILFTLAMALIVARMSDVMALNVCDPCDDHDMCGEGKNCVLTPGSTDAGVCALSRCVTSADCCNALTLRECNGNSSCHTKA